MDGDPLDAHFVSGRSKLDQLLPHERSLYEEQVAFAEQLRKAVRPARKARQHRHVVTVKCSHERHAEPPFHGQYKISLLAKVGMEDGWPQGFQRCLDTPVPKRAA